MSWIRSFRSHREACDMRDVLTKHGFGKREDFDVVTSKTASRLFDLSYNHTAFMVRPCNKETQDLNSKYLLLAVQASNFLHGWIACTNTKKPRPKVS